MPELPEVETVRRGLEPVLAGQTLARVEQRRPDLRFPFSERFAERLTGRRIVTLDRRAKYLLARLDSDDVLVMHLGMSGRFSIRKPAEGASRPGAFVHGGGHDEKHDHVVFHVGSGATVTYNDPRRFGFMLLLPGAELEQHSLMRGLGVEPLGNGLNAAYLAARCQGKKTSLKAVLLDQRVIAGLGNIYVCEALFRAGLSPRRAASALATKSGAPTRRCERLVPAIHAVLQDAIRAGGSSLRDYHAPDGDLGYFQHAFAVYAREGLECLRPGCGGTVRRLVQSGRSTFYCPQCQR